MIVLFNGPVKYITDNIDRSKYTVYSDLDDSKTAHLTVTDLKPDIVITDDKKVNIFELTVPFEHNIKQRHKDKTNKYAHFFIDITLLSPTVEAFEIGSRGTITPGNRIRLQQIHKFINKSITFKTFSNNVSQLALTSSYYLFIHRKDPAWNSPGYFTPH